MSSRLLRAPFDTPNDTALTIAGLLAADVLDDVGERVYQNGEEYIREAAHADEVGYGLQNEVGKLVVAASVSTIGQSPDIHIHHIVTAPNERRRGYARSLLGFIAREAVSHPDLPGVRITLNAVNPEVFEGMGFKHTTNDLDLGDMAASISQFL